MASGDLLLHATLSNTSSSWDALQAGVEGPPADDSTPRLHHLADEVDAACDRLDDGLALVQLQPEPVGQEGLDVSPRVVQPLRE
jgi:hypothetical protein